MRGKFYAFFFFYFVCLAIAMIDCLLSKIPRYRIIVGAFLGRAASGAHILGRRVFRHWARGVCMGISSSKLDLLTQLLDELRRTVLSFFLTLPSLTVHHNHDLFQSRSR